MIRRSVFAKVVYICDTFSRIISLCALSHELQPGGLGLVKSHETVKLGIQAAFLRTADPKRA